MGLFDLRRGSGQGPNFGLGTSRSGLVEGAGSVTCTRHDGSWRSLRERTTGSVARHAFAEELGAMVFGPDRARSITSPLTPPLRAPRPTAGPRATRATGSPNVHRQISDLTPRVRVRETWVGHADHGSADADDASACRRDRERRAAVSEQMASVT